VSKGKASRILLGGPFSGGMSRNVEVHNAPSIMRKDDKYKQNLKPDGVDREKIDPNEL
jgi:hypothetical protein